MAKKPKEPELDAPEGEAPPPKERISLDRLAIVVTAVLLLAGVSGGTYWFFFAGKKEEKTAALAPPPKPPTFFDLPDVLVNLANTGNDRTQYLKVKVVLELPDASLVQQIQPVLPRVMDTFQVFLREMRATDLEGSAGVFRLREELTRRVNVAIAPSRINAVLFKEIVVQ
jgi:flagellar FliL protein